MNYVRHVMTEGVTKIAATAATHPKKTVWGITILSFALVGIGYATNFQMNVAADGLYTPFNSRVREHQQWVEVESGFPAVARNLRMIIHNANGEDSVLTMAGVESVFEAIDAVRTTQGFDEACAESDYEDVNGTHTCNIRSVALFWNNSLDIFHEQVTSNVDTILLVSNENYPDGTPMDIQEIMGLSEKHYSTIVEAKAFFVDVALPPLATDFEADAVDNLLNLRQSWASRRDHNLRLQILAYSSLESETTRSILRDIPLVPLVFIFMSGFTCLVFSRWDRVKSRSLLGLGAVVCVFLSLLTGYGLMFLCGVNFTSLTQILPFVMFGIGLDDAFIIIGSFNSTDPKKDIVDRIQETMRDIGMSIILTTVTTTVAFALGCTSQLPALYWMSFYAFSTMLIVFFYSITFFVALIALDEKRIQENRRDCCVCITVVEPNDDEETMETGEEDQAPTKEEPESDHDQKDDFLTRCMDTYCKWLMKRPVKFMVLFLSFFFVCFCAYSTSLFKQEFNVTEMLPEDSYADAYLSSSDRFGQRGWIVPSAYFRNVDQSDGDVQQQMEDYINDLVGIDAITTQPPLFWLRHFKNFLTYDDRLLDLTFNQQLEIFLSHSPFKELFGPHIVRDEETGDIIASRCVLYMDNIDVSSVDSQLQALHEQRSVTAAQPANVGSESENFFLWEYNMFTWDFYANTVVELRTTTLAGVFTVCFIGFLFIPHWSAVCFLFPLTSCLYIDLMGFLQFTGNHLNVVSYFSLVLSIGLTVDYLMHMLLRYHESPGNTREEKVQAALRSMGPSVLVGGLSTMLGVLPLAFSTSSLMRTVFVAFMGMVSLGVSHGLIVLPVVLSLVGPTEPLKEHKPKAKQLPKEPTDQAQAEPQSDMNNLMVPEFTV